MSFRAISYRMKTLQFVCLLVTAFAFNGVASACYYADGWQSSTTVHAISTVEAEWHSNYIQAYAHLTSPNQSRSDSDTSSIQQGSSVSAVASLAKNLEDGEYDWEAEFYESPWSPPDFQGGSTGYVAVAPFVRNQSVTFNPTSVDMQEDDSEFKITVVKSEGCTASSVTVQVSSNVTQANPPQGVLSYSIDPAVSSGPAVFMGSSASATWTFTTGSSNETTGKIVASGLITESSCVVDGQNGKEATLTVTP